MYPSATVPPMFAIAQLSLKDAGVGEGMEEGKLVVLWDTVGSDPGFGMEARAVCGPEDGVHASFRQ